ALPISVCTPVNASPASLRTQAHDSEPKWCATPFLCGSLIRYSMPVYLGASVITFSARTSIQRNFRFIAFVFSQQRICHKQKLNENRIFTAGGRRQGKLLAWKSAMEKTNRAGYREPTESLSR